MCVYFLPFSPQEKALSLSYYFAGTLITFQSTESKSTGENHEKPVWYLLQGPCPHWADLRFFNTPYSKSPGTYQGTLSRCILWRAGKQASKLHVFANFGGLPKGYRKLAKNYSKMREFGSPFHTSTFSTCSSFLPSHQWRDCKFRWHVLLQALNIQAQGLWSDFRH